MLGPTLHDALLSAAAEPLPGGGLLVTAVLLVLVAFGVPLFVVIGGFAVACFLAWPEYANTFESFQGFANNFNLIERMVELAEQPTMVAIPFFMIAGAIMSRGAIATRLVAFANALFGWLPGGLALSTIAACMFFAAISGSSPVTVITIGAIMLPALVQAGYGERLGLGLVTTAGTLGIIIPPSIPMIVYAIFATSAGEVVNIEDLFIAGIGPGLLIGALLAGYCLIRGRGIPRDSFSIKRVVATLLDGIWALFLPLFILGGIYLGVFNATEASAISVVLALGIELWIHRSLTLSDLPGILAETAVLMGSILVIVCVAFGFSEFMAIKEVPDAIVAWLAGFELTPFTFIVLLNILLLVVGCLMDIISAIILFVPLVAPIAGQLGFDPIHVGLIFIVNLEIGYLTPPLGLNLFVATTYFGKSFGLGHPLGAALPAAARAQPRHRDLGAVGVAGDQQPPQRPPVLDAVPVGDRPATRRGARRGGSPGARAAAARRPRCGAGRWRGRRIASGPDERPRVPKAHGRDGRQAGRRRGRRGRAAARRRGARGRGRRRGEHPGPDEGPGVPKAHGLHGRRDAVEPTRQW
jgi:C4-dicarboxylate transporter DctM subunit